MQLLLLAVFFYVGAKLSLAFAVMPEVLVMLWLPNSLLLAALFHFRARRYVYLAALIVVAEIAADFPTFSLIEAVLFAAINLLEVTIAYLLLRYWRFDPRFAAPSDLTKFVMAGPVIGAFATACAAGAIYSHFRGTQTSYFEFLRMWWFSDGLGLLILTPLFLSLWPPVPIAVEKRAALRWYDGIAVLGAMVVLVAFVLSDRGMIQGVSVRPILLFPLAVYAAARFSLRTMMAILAGAAFIVLFVTKNGQQPFGEMPIRETVVLVQESLFIMGVMSLGLAALLSQLRANKRELEARVRDRTAELSAANTQLEKLAVTDSLTGLLNRRALFNLLRWEMERAQRHRRDLAVIMFDIDHFKNVNDRYGHATGDVVLQRVAAVTGQASRSTDTMTRYGGEEFVLVAPETDKHSAVQLAERMRAALRSSDIVVDRDALRVTASFGVAMLRHDDANPEQVLRRADEALYAAKGGGRDCVVAEPSHA